MSNPASSAPFQVGSPSPPSPTPAAGSQKEQHPPFISSDQIPQTPASPLMSVSTQNYATNFASSQASPQATSQPANLSSPPSSVPMSTQVSQQPTVSTANSFPTPASSISGHFINSTFTDDTEHVDKHGAGNQGLGATSAPDEKMESIHQTEQAHRRTDHDRDAGPGTESGSTDYGIQGTTKDGDAMDIDQGAPAPSSAESSLDSLRKDFTSAFHLCKSSHTATGPDLSLDLVSLYGLGPIAKSVARMDAVTGEKINRLRKSYEGKLKGLGLSGRNKPIKSDGNLSGGLRQLTMWPEEEWQNQKVFGKEIKVAGMDTALHQLQMNAMKMEPGPVPNNDYWEDVLGHEKPSKSVGASDTAKKPSVPVRSVSQSNGTPVPAEPERARPSRGRKRHYDDNSFAGYGEGYADDDDDVGFYSNTEGIGKKKRKKDHVSKVSTPMSDRGGSYGVGMFGVGAR